MRICLALGFVALAFPAAAEGLKFSPRVVETCLEQDGWRDCIGSAAQACMEESESGYTTPGIQGCLSAEYEWWDAELNARYRELQAHAQIVDAEAPIEGLPPRPSDADALRDMQRAWIAYRDATCRYEELQWWGGTGASGAYVGCLMRLTGEQALTLRSYLAEG